MLGEADVPTPFAIATRRHLLGCTLILGVGVGGCLAEAPEDIEAIEETDEALSLRPVAELKRKARDLVGKVTAADRSEYLSRTNASAWLREQTENAGFTPEDTIFVVRPKKYELAFGIPFDHSEVDIVEARQGDRRAPLQGRLVGDAWGSGLYRGTLPGYDLGPPLCVNWDELAAAVDRAYVWGVYGVTFVCHNTSFRVLDTLGVSVSDYSWQVRGWKLASYAYGPILAKTRSAPASWSAAARRCVTLGIE